ncbi:sensor histidine kinase [Streptomyces caatingaensis]|uniref:sensor histidine kinase n=1 Tax=Streptomyces caatingaensis TaxID=1678637 RepID=UPI00069D3AFD|nr:histidine kinase [Streptomyces caatingaensis]
MDDLSRHHGYRFDPTGWPSRRAPERRPTPAARLGGGALSVSFLGFLALPAVAALDGTYGSVRSALLLGCVIAYGLSFLLVFWCGSRAGRAGRVAMVGWLVLLGAGIVALTGEFNTLFLLGYALAGAMLLLPPWAGPALGAAAAAAGLALSASSANGPQWLGSALLLLAALSVTSTFLLIDALVQLKAAGARIAELAMAQERSRLGQDLHDVLGHSLTVITVKSGLLRRLLESGAGEERVRAEVLDIEELSRRALAEVRATVSDCRQLTLAGELAGARRALAAAGIAADLPQAVDEVPARLQEVFAYVVREGITNVIKHSGAGRCTVRLGPSWVEVRDDGTGAGGPHGGGGHGLSGLDGRLRRAGGTLTAHRLPDGGFLLRAACDDGRP